MVSDQGAGSLTSCCWDLEPCSSPSPGQELQLETGNTFQSPASPMHLFSRCVAPVPNLSILMMMSTSPSHPTGRKVHPIGDVGPGSVGGVRGSEHLWWASFDERSPARF